MTTYSFSFAIPARGSAELQPTFNADNENDIDVLDTKHNTKTQFNNKYDAMKTSKTVKNDEDAEVVYIVTGQYKNHSAAPNGNPDESWNNSPGNEFYNNTSSNTVAGQDKGKDVLITTTTNVILYGFDDTCNGTVTEGHYRYQNALLHVTITSQTQKPVQVGDKALVGAGARIWFVIQKWRASPVFFSIERGWQRIAASLLKNDDKQSRPAIDADNGT